MDIENCIWHVLIRLKKTQGHYASLHEITLASWRYVPPAASMFNELTVPTAVISRAWALTHGGNKKRTKNINSEHEHKPQKVREHRNTTKQYSCYHGTLPPIMVQLVRTVANTRRGLRQAVALFTSYSINIITITQRRHIHSSFAAHLDFTLCSSQFNW